MSRLEIAICLALIAATLLVFGQTADFQFINLDDDTNVYANPVVQGGLTLAGLAWAFTTTRPDYWHPIPWISHMLDVQWFGMNPGPQHLTNVFIHILNVLLLFWILRRMTGAVWRSAAVAALFAIHPLRAESVAWITERKDVLGGLFWWLTTWAYLEYARHSGSWKRYGLVVLLFVLALMAKPTTLTLPFFLLLLDYWPLKRRAVREKIPLFVLSSACVWFTFHAQRLVGATEQAGYIALPVRLANAVVAYATYLVDMVWPFHLAAIYPYNRHLGTWQIALAGLLLLAVTVLVLWKAARFPYLAVGWFWYLGVLLPVAGLVQMGFQSRADRFTYIPLVGVFVMVVWGLNDLMSGWRHARTVALALAVVALPALGVRAWSQVGYWRDSLTLFQHNVAVTPENQWALNSLGSTLLDQGRTDEAIPCFARAARLDPTYQQAYNNLGSAWFQKGKLDEALLNYSAAVRISPGDPDTRYNRAAVLMGLGRLEEASAEFQKAMGLGLSPQLTALAQADLGVIASRRGNHAEALSHFSRALSLNPGFAEARRNLAITLMNLGRKEEAIQQFTLLLSITPGDGQAREYLNQLQEKR